MDITVQQAYEQKLFLDDDFDLSFKLANGGEWEHIIYNIREVEFEDHLVVQCGVCLREFCLSPDLILEQRMLT